MRKVWSALRSLFPRRAYYRKDGDYYQDREGGRFAVSFSLEGEDLVTDQLLRMPDQGFYVDVGALHPVRYSNTYLFYRRGWSGINIEPTPDGIDLFQQRRPRDTNLNLGISAQEGELTLHLMDDPALNTFDEQRKEKLERETPYRCIGTALVPTRPLAAVLAEYAGDRRIDFLTIDVELHEQQVLESNDWERFRPRLVLVEILESPLEDVGRDPIHRMMKQNEYSLIAMTGRTAFYSDDRDWEAQP